MNNDYEHKSEIVATRVGALGGSDGAMLKRIAYLGYVPSTSYERLAIAKGLIPPTESFTTTEMEFGDYIENQIYEYLKSSDNGVYESNPCWVSEKYSKKNIKLLCHPDIVKVDEEKKTIFIYEVKATKYNVKTTKETYRSQMYIEHELGKELASQRGNDWRVKLFLVHYDTNGLNLKEGFSFETERFGLHKMSFSKIFDINEAMEIVNLFMATFDEYYVGDVIDSEYLPEKVKNEFIAITNALVEIKEREAKVAEFKARLYEFMDKHGIKNIKNDEWAITRVDPTIAVSFDSKSFISDYTNAHPRKAKQLLKRYEKRSNKKGYVSIKIKNNP